MWKILKSLKKLTKRLTVFDYLSLALAIGVILIIGFFFLRKWEWVEAEIKVAPESYFWLEGVNSPHWLANKINVGDYELDGLGRKMAEVLDTRIYESGGVGERTVHLKIKFRVIRDWRKKEYLFKSRPLQIGSPVELRLSRVFLTGLVTYIEGVPDTRVWEEKIIEARALMLDEIFPETTGLMPWVVEAVEIGDKMYDRQERIIAEILDKKVRPAEKIVQTSSGRVLIQTDPIKKDLFLKIRLKTVKEDGINYYLDDIEVKVDRTVPLHLSNIDINPVITKILE